MSNMDAIMGFISASGIVSAAPTGGWVTLRAIMLAPLSVLLLAGAAPTGSVELEITNLRSTKGVIRICLTDREQSFPDCQDDPRAISRSIPATQTRVKLEGLAPGTYAAAIIHD